ncbi:MAG: DUF4129 domain-containing protein [Ferruginibacter sp.]
MLKLLIVFWFCIIAGQTVAQQKEYVYSDSSLLQSGEDAKDKLVNLSPLPIDTFLFINKKSFSVDSVSALKKQPGFSYMKYIDSLLKKKQADEKAAMNSTVQKQGALQRFFSSGILKGILWALAIIFIVIIIYHIFLNNILFRMKPKNYLPETVTEEEQFFLTDFDALIRQSYLLADYRLATRYLFLKTLRSLSEKELIQYDASKTNSQYLHEMPLSLQTGFQALLLSYERVWYGHSAIPQLAYQRLETRFKSFDEKNLS